MGTYVYDQEWRAERERLAGIERLWDDGTFALLERLGVAPGWHVADVGAGGGSVVEWLADRVGSEGRVLAADVYLKFLEPLAGEAVEVAEHDILSTPLPEKEFELVHARLLVEHIGTKALPNLIAGLKPGGVLLLEDYDFGCQGTAPPDPAFDRVLEAVLDLMEAAGYDRAFGRKLPGLLEDAGLRDVQAEGRVRLIRGGTPDTAFSKLTLTVLRDRVIEAGRATGEEIDAILSRIDDHGYTALSPALVACWGRAPE